MSLELALRHYDWVREIIETHKNDERICMWDIYNEVGNAKRDQATMPHLKKFFEIAREIDPIQPLTCCVWRLPADRHQPFSEIEQFALANSDIISYHNYGTYESNIQQIKRLKETYGRPHRQHGMAGPLPAQHRAGDVPAVLSGKDRLLQLGLCGGQVSDL